MNRIENYRAEFRQLQQEAGEHLTLSEFEYCSQRLKESENDLTPDTLHSLGAPVQIDLAAIGGDDSRDDEFARQFDLLSSAEPALMAGFTRDGFVLQRRIDEGLLSNAELRRLRDRSLRNVNRNTRRRTNYASGLY